MHLLHEGRVRVNIAAWSQDAVQLLNTAMRIHHMLQNGLNYDSIERAFLERKIVPIADQRAARTKGDIGFDKFESRVAYELFHSFTDNASADDQNTRFPVFSAQETGKTLVIPSCADVLTDSRHKPGQEFLKGRASREERVALFGEIFEGKDAPLLINDHWNAIDNRIRRLTIGVSAQQNTRYDIKRAEAAATANDFSDPIRDGREVVLFAG